jgi:threonine aldolase
LARLALAPAANEIFAVLSKQTDARLKRAGAVYYPWRSAFMPRGATPGPDEVLARLVTSFATTEAEVDEFGKVLHA